ncbi:cytochrome ubiquinol oxidase subunit I, partial [Acetobacter pomorum]|uniref:cytochrome ubiquinol oxidase subunit I n=1 Tax=Acetobacter pomorum TaxID=65959 RepID=UPI003571396C
MLRNHYGKKLSKFYSSCYKFWKVSMQYAHDPALLLARFQFAFTVGVHIIFPAFSIGLAAYLAVLEGL